MVRLSGSVSGAGGGAGSGTKPAFTISVALRAAIHAPARTLAGLMAASVLVSACGGGGGGPDGGPTCIAIHEEGCLSPAQFEEKAAALAGEIRHRPDFFQQWGLAAIKADKAYAHLALVEGDDVRPGEGQTIGIIDTGIDETHPLFEGTTITEELLQGASDETGDEFSHGTAVASVIAAPRPPVPYPNVAHGVAWGADLAVFAITIGMEPESGHFNPVSLAELESEDAESAAVFRHVLAWEGARGRLDFLNLSFEYPGLVDYYPEADLRANHGETIEVLAQADAGEKTILVWGAGNAHGASCTGNEAWCVQREVEATLCAAAGTSDAAAGTSEACQRGEVDAHTVGILAGLPVHIEEMRGHSLAVVATSADGAIADFSNRCGSAAEWCLAAPGEDILVAYTGPGLDGGAKVQQMDLRHGTSFAAPMVTGGLAVMKHFFRDQLSNTALAARLLATADSSGRYADAAVYGHGLMDLGAATSPVGTSRLSLAGTVDGASAPLAATGLVAGGALGDGFAHSLAGREIAAFDALGAPFWFDLGDFASVRDDDSMSARLRDFMAPATGLPGLGARPIVSLRREHGAWTARDEDPAGLQLGLLDTTAGAGGGHLGLAEHALTLSLEGPGGLAATAFSTEGTDGVSPASGALLSWSAGGTPFALRAGWLAEREEMLGTSGRGAFASLSADAVFTGIGAETHLGGWKLVGGAELGTVSAGRDDGLIAGLSPLTTSAFAFHAMRTLGDDQGLRLSISQPLRVESGQAVLSVPAGRTKEGGVLRRPVSAGLSPTGRQIDVAARWHRRWTGGGELRLGAVWTREPGHRSAADPSLALLAGWRQTF